MTEFAVRELVEVLAYLIGRLGPLTRSIGGSVAFTVRGEGCWIVDLDQSGGQWREVTGNPKASAIVRATRSSFPSILLAPDRVPTLLERGEIAVVGDRSKFVRLAELMDQGRGIIGVRVRKKGRS
jgi:hypothetical protein